MSFADQPLLRRPLRFHVFLSLLFIGLLGAAFFFQYSGSPNESTNGVGIFVRNFYSDKSMPFYVSHRKILQSPPGNKVETDRIWVDKCSPSDILITQGPTDPLPNGIPTYTVEISNVCPTGCDISHIHLNCGWFSSARLINPRIFKRLRYDDCLVNDGHPLTNGRTISFQYANTFSYRLSVSSVNC